MAKTGYVYIMTNKKHGVLYSGVTSNLIQRDYQHKNEMVEGFTKKYKCKMLVYYEVHEDITTAIAYEKKLKNRGRQWKIDLIKKMNPEWKDLSEEINK